MALMVVNCKAYEKVIGNNVERLAEISEKVSKEFGVEIFLAVQPSDISRASGILGEGKARVIAQYVDPIDFGAHTGRIHPKVVKEAGAIGALVNHAEIRVSPETVKKAVKACKEMGLKTIVCTDSIEQACEFTKLGPDYISFEVPELIGTGNSISREQPEAVREFTRKVKGANPGVVPLCGAGVSTEQDCRKALELGTKGVLLASAVPKAENMEEKLRELARGLQ